MKIPSFHSELLCPVHPPIRSTCQCSKQGRAGRGSHVGNSIQPAVMVNLLIYCGDAVTTTSVIMRTFFPFPQPQDLHRLSTTLH